ncbi:MAG: type I-E CRISPR-associated protein Cas6/Cse3/CasE [Stellaceae bacterium]
MTPPTLVRLLPDLPGLARAAAERGLIGRGGDLGYALHAALRAGFGEAAPKPFVLRVESQEPQLLGYVTDDPETVLMHAALPPVADADLIASMRLPGLEARALPAAWRPGQTLDFEVRARPVIRTRPQGRDGPTRERDVFFAAIAGTPLPCETVPHRSWPQRERVYAEWLARELGRGDAAAVEAARLIAFRRTRVLSRPLGRDGRRRPSESEGPEALLRGRLRIKDGAGFAELLARGVGRHRAFGFGMLLLAPPGRLIARD